MRYPRTKIGIQSLLSLGIFLSAASFAHAQTPIDPLRAFENLVQSEEASTTTVATSTSNETSSAPTTTPAGTTTPVVPLSPTSTSTPTTTRDDNEDEEGTVATSSPTTTPPILPPIVEETPPPEEEEEATSTPVLSVAPLPPPSALSNVYARMGPLPEEITRLFLQVAAVFAIIGFLLIEQRTLEKISYAFAALLRPRSKKHRQKEATKA